MADTRQRTTWGTRFRFLARAAGLTGVLAAAVGAALYAAAFPPYGRWDLATLRAAAEGGHGDFAKAAALTLGGGAVAAVVALAVELLGGLFLVAGRRTATNTSAAVGVAAAVALLVFVNAYSFTHHARYDLTRGRQFTLPADLADKLRTLRPESPTTIVVLQKHQVFGTLSEGRDSYTSGAEQKVTEKVKDLVDLFREFGPRFRVEVLDTEAFGYDRRLADLTADAPELRAAVDAAPENSIFFHANKRVQRLAFNEFLQLDRTASREANGGRGNLVLLPQGVENFARRVLSVQERRPKVGVCVVHEWLSTANALGQDPYTLAGFKRALADHGFEVVDVILKKNWDDPGKELEPAAYTVAESKLERLEAELDAARDQYRAAGNDVKLLASVRQALDESAARPFRDRAEFLSELSRVAIVRGWAELGKAYREWAGDGPPVIREDNEAELRKAVAAGLARQTARAEQEVREAEKARAEAEAQARGASQDERAAEARRQADVKAKFAALVADVDLLVIPRYTVVNATIGRGVDPELHTLSKAQVEVVRDFMKAGKPVLACLGSLSGPNGFDSRGVDDLERLLAERGVELGRDTVLYDAEARAFAAIKSGRQLGGSATDIPPLVFTAPDGAGKANPVGSAVRLTGRAVDQKLDLRLQAPRPVYLAPGRQDRLGYAAEFVFTGPDTWNEERPFLSRAGRGVAAPRYEPTLDTDKAWGTRQAERRGPFPVGVAVEGKVPAAWFNEAYDQEAFVAALVAPLDGGVSAAALTAAAAKLDRPVGRLVVFGSGNLFTGPKLDPAREKLLLHSANWLTGRDDRLPRADEPAWEFPRVAMTERDFYLWRYGTGLVLPLGAVFVGLVATMVRRLR